MTNPGTSNLVGYWSMDELDDSSARASKVSGIGSLSVSGTPTPSDISMYGVSTNLVASSNDYLTGPTAGFAQMGNFHFTIGGWIRLHGVGATGRIIGKWTASGKEYLLWFDTVSRDVYFGLYDGSSNQLVAATNHGDLVAGKWYFCVGYYDSVNNLVGVGVNDVWNTAAGGTVGAAIGTTQFTVGCDPDGSTDQFNGVVDEMFVYRQRLLTSAELTWLYNSGLGRSYHDIAEDDPPSKTILIPSPNDVVPIHVLDSSLIPIGIIEDYYSLVWTERFNEVGDFELELPIVYQNDSLLAFGNYLEIPTSDKIMIIENVKPTYNQDQESMVIEGESIEAILKRRIIKDDVYTIHQGDVDEDGYGNAQKAIYRLLWENIIFPVLNNDGDTDRKIDIVSEDYVQMSDIGSYEEQFDRQSIYDIIKTISKNTVFAGGWTPTGYKGLGFKMVKTSSDEFLFYVYEGVDRSHEQVGFVKNPYVLFSKNEGNVISSSVYETEKDKVTVVLVTSEDVTYPSVYVWADGTSEGPTGNEPTGLDRIESSIEVNIDRTAVTPNLTDSEVLAIITAKGQEVLNVGSSAVFEGEFDILLGPYVYGVDFFIGDVVQCQLAERNLPGRVIEVVQSYSNEGHTAYVSMDYDI
jgi:hypothetical protein